MGRTRTWESLKCNLPVIQDTKIYVPGEYCRYTIHMWRLSINVISSGQHLIGIKKRCIILCDGKNRTVTTFIGIGDIHP
jgi:hypothetical protein